MSIEQKILSNLVYNEPYARRVIPFLEPDYFHTESERIVFEAIARHYVKYNTVPTTESLTIDLEDKSFNETIYENVSKTIGTIDDKSVEETDWLFDQTEKFCQDKAVYNAIMESIGILDGKEGKKNKTAIPEILSKALGVSFDPHVGHDFIEDAETRFSSYHRKEEKIDFDLDYMNRITNGGFSKKSLNVILAGTGAGKSLAMCHFASHNLTQGLNVLYITLEMAEEAIAKRIDANLMNIPYNDIDHLPKDIYDKKINQIKQRTKGKLVIKEYPTASAHTLHFKTLLKELELKKKFKPDIIYVDYINLCASSRLKGSITANSYTIVKAIAEELRGLAVEHNVPIITATQTNREGYSNSDIGLENTSESFGLPATADFMFALIRSDELDQLGQVMIKQLKNRYNDPTLHRRFVLGIDKTKFRLYDVEQDAQDLQDDIPVMDRIEAARSKPVISFGDLKV